MGECVYVWEGVGVHDLQNLQKEEDKNIPLTQSLNGT